MSGQTRYQFAESGTALRPHLELGSNEAIKQAILAGLGISALSHHALALPTSSPCST